MPSSLRHQIHLLATSRACLPPRTPKAAAALETVVAAFPLGAFMGLPARADALERRSELAALRFAAPHSFRAGFQFLPARRGPGAPSVMQTASGSAVGIRNNNRSALRLLHITRARLVFSLRPRGESPTSRAHGGRGCARWNYRGYQRAPRTFLF